MQAVILVAIITMVSTVGCSHSSTVISTDSSPFRCPDDAREIRGLDPVELLLTGAGCLNVARRAQEMYYRIAVEAVVKQCFAERRACDVLVLAALADDQVALARRIYQLILSSGIVSPGLGLFGVALENEPCSRHDIITTLQGFDDVGKYVEGMYGLLAILSSVENKERGRWYAEKAIEKEESLVRCVICNDGFRCAFPGGAVTSCDLKE